MSKQDLNYSNPDDVDLLRFDFNLFWTEKRQEMEGAIIQVNYYYLLYSFKVQTES